MNENPIFTILAAITIMIVLGIVFSVFNPSMILGIIFIVAVLFCLVGLIEHFNRK